jgi:hypothetical protein
MSVLTAKKPEADPTVAGKPPTLDDFPAYTKAVADLVAREEEKTELERELNRRLRIGELHHENANIDRENQVREQQVREAVDKGVPVKDVVARARAQAKKETADLQEIRQAISVCDLITKELRLKVEQEAREAKIQMIDALRPEYAALVKGFAVCIAQAVKAQRRIEDFVKAKGGGVLSEIGGEVFGKNLYAGEVGKTLRKAVDHGLLTGKEPELKELNCFEGTTQ